MYMLHIIIPLSVEFCLLKTKVYIKKVEPAEADSTQNDFYFCVTARRKACVRSIFGWSKISSGVPSSVM